MRESRELFYTFGCFNIMAWKRSRVGLGRSDGIGVEIAIKMDNVSRFVTQFSKQRVEIAIKMD